MKNHAAKKSPQNKKEKDKGKTSFVKTINLNGDRKIKDPNVRGREDRQSVKFQYEKINKTQSVSNNVRTTMKPKTMTNIKLSFDSNLGSDQLAEFLYSKNSGSFRPDQNSTPDSEVFFSVSSNES